MILRFNKFQFLNVFDDIVGKENDYLQTFRNKFNKRHINGGGISGLWT